MGSIISFSRKTITVLLVCVATLLCSTAFAQTFAVGKIVDANGEPVIGASVVEKGTRNGAMTDVDGKFSIRVAQGAQLEVSCIGYLTQTVAAAANLQIVLAEDTLLLDEAIAVGYGVMRKSDITGATVRVSSDELTSRPVNNAFEALQGKAAGVDITSAARPGEVGGIRIRGNRSISASGSPLYVVDGVPLSAGGIESLNPHDIESIDILKDASSTAIYGSRGANGVVLVTTKRAQAGRTSLSYSGSVTFENLVDYSPAMPASDYITWRRWAYHNNNPEVHPRGDQPNYDSDQEFFSASGDPVAQANVNRGWVNNNTWDGSKVIDTDWSKLVTRTGISHEHSVSGSAGTDKAQAFFSVGYLNNQGTQKGQEYERYNFNVAVDIQATPWFKMGGSINASWAVQDYGYSRSGQVGTSSGPVDIYNAAKAIPRFALPYDENNEIIAQPAGSTTKVYTVIDEWTKSTDNRQTFRALGSFYGLIDFGQIFKVLDGLSYKISFGPDFRNRRNGFFLSSESATRMGGKNTASYENQRHTAWTLDNQINYNKTIGLSKLGITLLQSASAYKRENGKMSANAIPQEFYLWYNMDSVDVTDAATYGAGINTGYTANQLLSYMARVNYSYNDRYLLTVSGRYDGASVLADGHKWAFFPSAAIGWRIDQEDFMKDIDWINQFKLRFGVGTTGNSAVGAYSTLGNIASFFVPFGETGVQAYATNEPYYTSSMQQMANSKLGWEKTTQFNYGLDFSFLGGRIGGALDIYHSRTTDLILNMSIPTLTGFNSTKANIGETKNFGIDLSLNVIPVKTRDFEWYSSLNLSYSHDEIVLLANGKEDDIANAWFIGKPISVHYGIANAGLWQAEDKAEMDAFNENGHTFTPGNVRPVDVNNDHKIDNEDRQILGQKNPSWVMGWTNTFSYKGLELSIDLNGRFGYMVNFGAEGQNGMYNQRMIDYWTPDNTDAEYQKPIYSEAGGDPYSGLLGFRKASFIKIRNISLGYNFNPKALRSVGVKSLKLYAQAKNIGDLYTTCKFIDLDLNQTFFNRGVTFGVQVGF